MKSVHYIYGKLRIQFSGNDTKEINKLLKFPEMEKVNSTTFTVYPTKEMLIFLRQNRFIFSKSTKSLEQGLSVKVSTKVKKETEKIVDELKLYPFQEKGVQFINTYHPLKPAGSGLIADEMGLGKTVQALAWIKQNKSFPVLVVCPASLKYQWEREIQKWLDVSSNVLSGSVPNDIYDDKIVVINYDILTYWVDQLKDYGFETIIVDEAHLIKNNKAQRTKAFKKVAKKIDNKIALTGTPIENKPVEIYNIISIISPYLFPNFMHFAMEYCGAKKTRFGWDFTGSTNSKKLNALLTETVMIRRLKKDVLKELPPKQIVILPIEIDNKMEYQKAEQEFVRFVYEKFNQNLTEELKKELKEYAKRQQIQVSDELTGFEAEYLIEKKIIGAQAAPILSQIEALKQLAIKGKMKQIISWVHEFLESGEKLVLFAVHRKVIDELLLSFPKAVKIDGSVTGRKRQKVVDQFQNDPNTKLFIGNIKAAGVGITLTSASNAAIIEFPWTPGELAQATDRIHRITQTKQVTIYQLVGVNTIEEKILNLLKKKEKIIGLVLDGGVQETDVTIFNELINEYKR